MLRISCPKSYEPERRYVLKFLLSSRFGIDFTFETEDRVDTIVRGPNDGELIIVDGLFRTAPSDWLAVQSLPASPPHVMQQSRLASIDDRVEANLPFLPTATGPRCAAIAVESESRLVISADLLGSAFFFLARYEEIARPKLGDRFGRFPAAGCYAAKNGFLDRPVVDEYAALLAACVSYLWPNIPMKQSTFRTEVSHDVDLPLKYGFAGVTRTVAGGLRDFARNRSLDQVVGRFRTWRSVRRGNMEVDPYNTFARLMHESERRGLRSAFYFIADRPAGTRDALYEIDHPWITDLIRSISTAGHEVGLHASFDSYLCGRRTKREFDKLKTVCDRVGVRQSRWGGRQHYLRWKTPSTYRNWEAAGLDYDSSMTFAQQAGFRCGTSHEFAPFDPLERREMRLIERPLVAMESSVTSYMNLGLGDAALAEFRKLKERCRRHGGVFSLLWHNSNLSTNAQWRLYLDVLDA